MVSITSFLLATFAVVNATPTLKEGSSPSYTVAEPAITSQGTINFNGGAVMASGVNVYAIFYGDHQDSTKQIVSNFISGLGASDWWGVVSEYTGSNGAINSNVKLAGTYHDNYSKGKKLSSSFFGSDQSTVISSAITASKWPQDPNGIYVIFVAKDVVESSRSGSFCKDYCGYHDITNNLKYAVIGNAQACPGTLPVPGATVGTPGCMQRYWRNQTDPTYSVNRDQAGDSMVDVLAHELAETASDYGNAWRDGAGYENGDKCAPYFIKVQGVGASAPYNNAYNVQFGGNKYLIQSMWSPKSQSCVLSSSAEKPAAARVVREMN